MTKLEFSNLLTELRNNQIKLWVEGDNLRYKAPDTGFPAELQHKVQNQKTEIIQFLKLIAENKQRHESIKPVSRKMKLPLSFTEERQWFIHQLEPTAPVYHIHQGFNLIGRLEVNALEKSIEAMIHRHESLRTTYSQEQESVFRHIAEPESFSLPVNDLSLMQESEKQKELLLRVTEEANGVFDLKQGPLFRTRLICLAPQEHVFLLTLHHIISDGWSSGIFWRELNALYHSFCNHQSVQLPDLPVQYADFAHWQRLRETDILSAELDYWKNQLLNTPPLLKLPTDHPRPSQLTYQGGSVSFSLSSVLSKKLRQLSQDENVTLFMLLITVFKILLSRYSGQTDIVVGTPIANRTSVQIENLIGLFANTLVLRSELADNPSFRNLLGQVRATLLDAYQHQELPFEKLVEELQPERSFSHHPVFQVMFVYQNVHQEKLSLDSVNISRLPGENSVAKFDLTLTIHQQEEELNATVSYSSNLFEKATIIRIADHFQILLEGIVTRPDLGINELSLHTEAEKLQLLQWNQTEAAYPETKTFVDLLATQVEKTPDSIAVVFESQQLSYRELDVKSNRLASRLITLGARADSLVALYVERSLEMVIGLLAILKSGGAYVPVNLADPEERVRLILEDCGATVMVTTSNLKHVASSYCKHCVCIDNEINATQPVETDLKKPHITPNHLAYVIYTSGSTGIPKGVAIEHHSLTNLIHHTVNTVFSPADMKVVAAIAPITFDVSINNILVPFCCGGKVVVAENLFTLPASPAYEEITLLNTVPTLLEAFLCEYKLPASLINLIIGASLAKEKLIELLSDKQPNSFRLFNFYGPTEATVNCTTAELTFLLTGDCKDGANKLKRIGKPFPNTQAFVLNKDHQILPVGVIGELYIAGTCLARGYLNQPELSQEKFIEIVLPGKKQRVYKTGDQARWLADGNLEFLGRTDHQVKLRGIRIELGEIEAVLNHHEDVQVSVVVVNELNENSSLSAYVVAANQSSLSIADLNTHLAAHLPDYMIPASITMLEKLPLLPSGKLDFKNLPKAEFIDDAESIALISETEQILASFWSELLKINVDSSAASFFRLGGHSLLAIQLISRIKSSFLVDIPVRTFFETPTIKELALYIDNHSLLTFNNKPLSPLQDDEEDFEI